MNSELMAARPRIRLAGKESAPLTEGLVRLKIREDQQGLCRCDATFGNWSSSGDVGLLDVDRPVGFLYFDRQMVEFGREFAVTLDKPSLFSGRITGIEGTFPDGRSPEVTVLAEDRLLDLRMTRRTRSFADMSDADVMRQIAADHGLTPDVDVTGPTHRVLAQLNQSDLAFLRERARAVDAEVWVNGLTLSVKAHARRAGGSLRLGYGNELIEFTVLADIADQRSSVTVTGWDVPGKQAISEVVDEASMTSELAGLEGGASILRSAFAERRENVVHAMPFAGDEARARAEALFRGRARGFVRGQGIAQTNAELQVGVTVQLDGLGPLFSGDFYVAEVTHRFDGERGMRTEFTAERPGLGRATAK